MDLAAIDQTFHAIRDQVTRALHCVVRSIEINARQCPPNVHNVLATATEILLTKLSQASLDDTTELPQYVVVLENWLMIELEHQNTLTQRLMEVLHHLPETVRTSLCSVLKT